MEERGKVIEENDVDNGDDEGKENRRRKEGKVHLLLLQYLSSNWFQQHHFCFLFSLFVIFFSIEKGQMQLLIDQLDSE